MKAPKGIDPTLWKAIERWEKRLERDGEGVFYLIQQRHKLSLARTIQAVLPDLPLKEDPK